MNIVCTNVNHASRSGEPDWRTVLGRIDGVAIAPQAWCRACVRLEPPVTTVWDKTQAEIRITRQGDVYFVVPGVTSQGQQREHQTDVIPFATIGTAGERSTVRTWADKAKAAVRDQDLPALVAGTRTS